MARPLVRRPTSTIIALTLALIGASLTLVSLAEHPSERRYLMELGLISPMILIALGNLVKRYR